MHKPEITPAAFDKGRDAAQLHSSANQYRLADVTSRTGLAPADVLSLETIGAFPSSACHHEQGRFWLAAEVDDFARFLDEPGIREWMTALLKRSEVHS